MHTHLNVTVSLEERNQFHIRCTPASSSSKNLVEPFRADLIKNCVRDGSSACVNEFRDSTAA